MSAAVLARSGTAAEEAFAQVRGTADPVVPHEPPRRPQARLVAAPPPATVEEAAGPVHAVPLTAAARIAVLRARDRPPVDEADDEPGPLPDGDPAVVARTIALAALEVLAGRRSAAQLARWLTPGVYDSLQVRAGLTQRVLGDARNGRPPVIRRARACRVGTHALEASVIADDGARVRAVAIRLEGHRGAWRATALEIG